MAAAVSAFTGAFVDCLLPLQSAWLSQEDSLPRGQSTLSFIRETNAMSLGVSHLHFWFTAAGAGSDVSVSLVVAWSFLNSDLVTLGDPPNASWTTLSQSI